MKRRLTRHLILGVLLVCATARPARASGHVTSGAYDPLFAVLIILGAALPSEFGAFIPDGDARFLLGWAWQVPVPTEHHRVIGGVDYIFGDVGDHVRARIGYRFDWKSLIAGGAAAFDHDGLTWSPEVGIKFLHFQPNHDAETDSSLHLLFRANLAPAFNHFVGLSVLLGWNVF